MNKLLAALFFSLVTVAAGCAGPRQVSRLDYPADTAAAAGAEVERSDTLLILVHGRMDTAKAFDEEGLIKDLRERGSTADIVSLGAAPDLFRRRIFADSVEHQVVEPAREQGYQRIFIVGISRGGMGVLTYARKYPNSVDGVLAIAPFLGPRALVEDLERQ
ncbi:MAG: alpha/beta fold hydrolase, partial [Myxococcota bacterium]